jgi:hypothetical protein
VKHLLVKGTPGSFREGFFLNPKTNIIEYTRSPKGVSLCGITDTQSPQKLIGVLREDVIQRISKSTEFFLQAFTFYWFITIDMTLYKAEVYLRSECLPLNQFWSTCGQIADFEGVVTEEE